jgi:uncharacterized Fe-S cluster-containing radical SAM superfamily protein
MSARLGLDQSDIIRAQIFQNAICNWRCWYCFVPFHLLSADQRHAAWLTAGQLVEFYLSLPARPPMIDLTGGQPDLAPEWVPWMMEALEDYGLADEVYLWSDDNLSTDYFWRYLSDQHIDRVRGFKNYGRVCCFKGFDQESFSFNTLAAPELFNQQFELFSRLMGLGLDIYAYATFTTPNPLNIPSKMATFIDRLQELDENLPLRTVPLEVQVFTPVQGRMNSTKMQSLAIQERVIHAWNEEIQRRFEPRLSTIVSRQVVEKPPRLSRWV